MFKHAPWASHEGNGSHEKHNEEEGESLTTILDAEQRGELTVLIAGATAAMRKAIESNFDSSVSVLYVRLRYYLSDLLRQRFLLSLMTASPKKKGS